MDACDRGVHTCGARQWAAGSTGSTASARMGEGDGGVDPARRQVAGAAREAGGRAARRDTSSIIILHIPSYVVLEWIDR
jgi:hypothetical protein